MASLSTGKLARITGIGVETIRFYERVGLLPKPPRRESGYRQYPEETTYRLRFIRRAKELGFTLREIKELLDLGVNVSTAAACNAVRKHAEEKIADVRSKIRSLQRIEAVLLHLVQSCQRRNPKDVCPILHLLEKEEANESE